MEPTVFAHTIGPAIEQLGGSFMLDDATTAIGAEHGLDFASFYGLGRASVLGKPSSAVVASAFPFIDAALAEPLWAAAAETLAPELAVEPYTRACQEWGRSNLVGLDNLERTCELLAQIVDAAPPHMGALFAGWRTVALPEDAPGRAAQLLHVARELRGGIHVAAIVASELTPLQAILAAEGSAGAQQYFWPEPYPDPEQFRAQHDAIMAATDRGFGQISEVLSADERTELAGLLAVAAAHVS